MLTSVSLSHWLQSSELQCAITKMTKICEKEKNRAHVGWYVFMPSGTSSAHFKPFLFYRYVVELGFEAFSAIQSINCWNIYFKKCSIQTLLNKTFHWILETLSKKTGFYGFFLRGRGVSSQFQEPFLTVQPNWKWPKMAQMFDIFGHKKWKIPILGGGGGEGFANVGQNPVFFTASLTFSDTANHLPVHLFQFTYNLDIFHIQPPLDVFRTNQQLCRSWSPF